MFTSSLSTASFPPPSSGPNSSSNLSFSDISHPSMNQLSSMASPANYNRSDNQQQFVPAQNGQELRESSSRCRANTGPSHIALSSASSTIDVTPSSSTSSFISSSHQSNELTGPHETSLAHHQPSVIKQFQSTTQHQAVGQQQQPVHQLSNQFDNSYYQNQLVGQQSFVSGNQQQEQVSKNYNVTWNENLVYTGDPFEYQDCTNNLYQQQEPYSYYTSDTSSTYPLMDPVQWYVLLCHLLNVLENFAKDYQLNKQVKEEGGVKVWCIYRKERFDTKWDW